MSRNDRGAAQAKAPPCRARPRRVRCPNGATILSPSGLPAKLEIAGRELAIDRVVAVRPYTTPTPQHLTCVTSNMSPHPAHHIDYGGLRRRAIARSRVASPPGASRAGNLRCAGAAVGPNSEGTWGMLKASCRARLHASKGLSPALSSCWRSLRSRRASAKVSSLRAKRSALSCASALAQWNSPAGCA